MCVSDSVCGCVSARLSLCRLVAFLNPALVLPETVPLVVGATPCRGRHLLTSVRVCVGVCRLCCLFTLCSHFCFLWDEPSIPSKTRTRIKLNTSNL